MRSLIKSTSSVEPIIKWRPNLDLPSDEMTIEAKLPIIELDRYLKFISQDTPLDLEAKRLCKEVSDAFVEFGAIIVKDSRVTIADNDKFLDQMEKYFEQDYQVKMKDARPELHYQVGVTPEGTEIPKCGFDLNCQEYVDKLTSENKPIMTKSPDAKWRFFWRIGDRPTDTEFPELNASPVIPYHFPQWERVMNEWGSHLLKAVEVISEMTAVGFGLERDALTRLTKLGPHLLAPTGSDLSKYNQLGQVFAGFHYDLNFLTIHGKSRFPGLEIWNSKGQKLQVKIPDGCLLVQAGKQMELLTGGVVKAGYHQVSVLPDTLNAIERARLNQKSLWRISSTLFYHVQSDCILRDLLSSKLSDGIKAGLQVQQELESINLKI